MYTRIFGTKDISKNIGLFGTLVILFLFLSNVILYGIVSTFSLLTYSGFSYIGMIIIFLAVIFGNRIKDFFNTQIRNGRTIMQ